MGQAKRPHQNRNTVYVRTVGKCKLPILILAILSLSATAFCGQNAAHPTVIKVWKLPENGDVVLKQHTTLFRPQYGQFRARMPVTLYYLEYRTGKQSRRIWWRQYLEWASPIDWGPADFHLQPAGPKQVAFAFVKDGRFLLFQLLNTEKPAGPVPKPFDQPPGRISTPMFGMVIRGRTPMHTFAILDALNRRPVDHAKPEKGGSWCSLRKMTWDASGQRWLFHLVVKEVVTDIRPTPKNRSASQVEVIVTTKDGRTWTIEKRSDTSPPSP